MPDTDDLNKSSDSTLTRQEFMKKALKGVTIAGGILAGPQIVDKFIVPKAYAATSFFTGCTAGLPTSSNSNSDVVAKNNNNIYCTNGGLPAGLTSGEATKMGSAGDTACDGTTGDATLNC